MGSLWEPVYFMFYLRIGGTVMSSRKRKSLGIGNGIAAWFGDKVQKIPNGIIFVAAVLSMIFKGWILSEYNGLVSKIVSSGITMTLFKT